MSDYTRYPPNGPSRRAVWLLILTLLVLLAANVAHQGGVG
jgi:hypothetical protein